MIITAGSINKSVYFYIIQDAGNTSPGEPVTGLLFSDIETGGSASYMRQGAARTDFTLVTLASASAAHIDGGFILVDDTNMPGLYRCDVPDAAFATGVDQVVIDLVVAAAKNAVVAPLLIDITDVDLRDGVRGGMTALPDAAADAAGGLPISVAGGFAVDGTALEATLGTPTDFGSGTSTLAANLQDMADNGTAVFDRSTDSLQALRDRGDAAWTTGAGGSDPFVLQNTTITGLVSQTVFNLTAGSADNGAYDNMLVVVEDSVTATQKAIGVIATYVGATKTITLREDPGVFTMANGDTIDVVVVSPDILDIAADVVNIDGAAMRGTDGANTTTPPTAAAVADAVWDEPLEDHDTEGQAGWVQMQLAYAGPRGPGVYIEDGAANTNVVPGTDGTLINPVSTLAAARTIADAIGSRTYYFTASDLTLAATHQDWCFCGLGELQTNVINLGSQDVDRSEFFNLTMEGTQGGSARIYADHCAFQDPGAGSTLLHIHATNCGIVDDISVDTSSDNVFEQCYSLVAGPLTPILRATGAAGTLSIRHYSGGLEFADLSASHNVTFATDGQVIFNASCNINANVSLYGTMLVTDNTAGMASLSEDATLNIPKIENAVWDASLTPTSHNDTNSAGKKLRQIPATIVREDTAQAGSANTITLDPAASAIDGAYDPAAIFISSGIGEGQTRAIIEYDGTTKIAVVDRNWKMNPDATSVFVIIGFPGREHVNEGLAQAGTANTITLNVLASTTDDAYNGQIVFIRSGTGEDQSGTVIAYNGTTKVATVHRNWGVTPDTTSGYVMLPASPVELTANTIDAILDEALVGHTTAGTLGKAVSDTDANVAAIKTKTDKLTFTSGNDLDANIQKVNDVIVNGTGAGGDEWGP